MRNIFSYKKSIAITVSILMILSVSPVSPVRAGIISTEQVPDLDPEHVSDRERLIAILARADVMAQLQAFGISHEEATSRVESLTDREIAVMAGRINQSRAGAGTNYEFDGSLLAIIGVAIYAIFMAIAIYFSRTMDNEEKTEGEE